MQLTTNGIVLRDIKIQEDRLLTLLTQSQGVITAYANKANRARNKLAAATELLCYSDFVLFRHKDRYTVDKADAQRLFFGIRSDLEKLSLASYFAELTAELAPHEEEAGVYLRLVLNCLHLLEKDLRPARQIKCIYELRLLTLAGYMPDLVACRECGSYEADSMFFFPASGELLCGNCLGSGDVGGIALTPGVLAAMRHIAYSQPDKLFSFSLSGEGLGLLVRICEAYLQYQVERTFSTLSFYHSLSAKDIYLNNIQEEPCL